MSSVGMDMFFSIQKIKFFLSNIATNSKDSKDVETKSKQQDFIP